MQLTTMMRRLLEDHRIEHSNNHGPSLPAGFAEDHPDRVLVKSVMMNIDGSLAMAVIPATHRLRLDLLGEIIGAESVRLAEPAELSDSLSDCEPDAIPPFGMLHGMRVFASDTLCRRQRLAFHAGTRSRVVELAWRDYFHLVVPIVAPISSPPGGLGRGRPEQERAPMQADDDARHAIAGGVWS